MTSAFLTLVGSYWLSGVESDFPFFKAVQHVASRNRVQAGVVDLPNGGPFLYINMNQPSLGGLLAFEADIFEISRVPQRIEVALDGRLIVNIARRG